VFFCLEITVDSLFTRFANYHYVRLRDTDNAKLMCILYRQDDPNQPCYQMIDFTKELPPWAIYVNMLRNAALRSHSSFLHLVEKASN